MEAVAVLTGPCIQNQLFYVGSHLIWPAQHGVVVTPYDTSPIGKEKEVKQKHSKYYRIHPFLTVENLSVYAQRGVEGCYYGVIGGKTIYDDDTSSMVGFAAGVIEIDLTESSPFTSAKLFDMKRRLVRAAFSDHKPIFATLFEVSGSSSFTLEDARPRIWSTLDVTLWHLNDDLTVRKIASVCFDKIMVTEVQYMSLSRGLPDSKEHIMIVAGYDGVWQWKYEEIKFGPRLESLQGCHLGIMTPSPILTAWNIAKEAFVVGMETGWVMIFVEGSALVRYGRASDSTKSSGAPPTPCHQGAVTDMWMEGEELLTVGSDGYLRIWEAEAIQDVVSGAAGFVPCEFVWAENTIYTAELQLIAEIEFHSGPGYPSQIVRVDHQHWCIQTSTGNIYKIFGKRWDVELIHQGPQGKIISHAISEITNDEYALIAIATDDQWLQVATIYSPKTEKTISDVIVPTSLASAGLLNKPTCLCWTTCLSTGNECIVIVGSEDGTVWLYYLHTQVQTKDTGSVSQASKTHGASLTLLEVEKVLDCSITILSSTSNMDVHSKDAKPLLCVVGVDMKVYIFAFIKVKKLTTFEPMGFYELDYLPTRVLIDKTTIKLRHPHGILRSYEVPESLGPSPPSWKLPLPVSKEILEEDKLMILSLLEEQFGFHSTPPIKSNDGLTIMGVGTEDCPEVVHLNNLKPSLVKVSSNDGLLTREDLIIAGIRKSPSNLISEKSSKGSWMSIWITGGDLVIYQQYTNISSFIKDNESSDSSVLTLRQITLRPLGGAVITAACNMSVEERAIRTAAENRRALMDSQSTALQQKIAKLMWDLRQVSSGISKYPDGLEALEELPLHPPITELLNQRSLANIKKVEDGSCLETKLLDIMLEKLHKLYFWNPNTSVISVKTILSTHCCEISEIDLSQEMLTILNHLRQVETTEKISVPKEEKEIKSSKVIGQLKEVLGDWLKNIRMQNLKQNELDVMLLKNRRQSMVWLNEKRDPTKKDISCEFFNQKVDELLNRIDTLRSSKLSAKASHGTSPRSQADGGDVTCQIRWRQRSIARLEKYNKSEEERERKENAISRPSKDSSGKIGSEGFRKERESSIKGSATGSEKSFGSSSMVYSVYEETMKTLVTKIEEISEIMKREIIHLAKKQTELLKKANETKSIDSLTAFTLPHLLRHEHIHVTDDLVDYFYDEVTNDGGDTERILDAHFFRNRDLKVSAIISYDEENAFNFAKIPSVVDAQMPFSDPTTPIIYQGVVPRLVDLSRKNEIKQKEEEQEEKTRSTARKSSSRTPKPTGRTKRSGHESYIEQPPAPRSSLTLKQIITLEKKRTVEWTNVDQVNPELVSAVQYLDKEILMSKRYLQDYQLRLAWGVVAAGELLKHLITSGKFVTKEVPLKQKRKEREQDEKEIMNKVEEIDRRIEVIVDNIEALKKLQKKLDAAFSGLIADNAEFEIQLTYTYNQTARKNKRDDSLIFEEDDSEDSYDSGVGGGQFLKSDEMEVSDKCPPGCDTATYDIVISLRENRLEVSDALVELESQKENEERRLTVLQKKLNKASTLKDQVLEELRTLEMEKNSEIGETVSPVWLKQENIGSAISQTDLDQILPFKTTDCLSDGKNSELILVPIWKLQHLQDTATANEKLREKIANQNRESRIKQKSFASEIRNLKTKLEILCDKCNETQRNKGLEKPVNELIKAVGATSHINWKSKIEAQRSRHAEQMKTIQNQIQTSRKELKVLTKEESALIAHILSLRKEKDHIQEILLRSNKNKKPMTPTSPGEEIIKLKNKIQKLDHSLSAVRTEISVLQGTAISNPPNSENPTNTEKPEDLLNDN